MPGQCPQKKNCGPNNPNCEPPKTLCADGVTEPPCERCPDGSKPPCQAPPVLCPDNVTVPVNGVCPVKPKCADGTYKDPCPVTQPELKCLDGQPPNENGECPSKSTESPVLPPSDLCVCPCSTAGATNQKVLPLIDPASAVTAAENSSATSLGYCDYSDTCSDKYIALVTAKK